jgi:hypothetical protein
MFSQSSAMVVVQLMVQVQIIEVVAYSSQGVEVTALSFDSSQRVFLTDILHHGGFYFPDLPGSTWERENEKIKALYI